MSERERELTLIAALVAVLQHEWQREGRGRWTCWVLGDEEPLFIALREVFGEAMARRLRDGWSAPERRCLSLEAPDIAHTG